MSRIENSNLSLKDIYFLLENPEKIKLNDSLKTKINQSFNRAQKMAKDPKPIYGINTGVGPLCTKKISPEETKSLQRNLLLSHSVGVGNPISPELSRIMLLCKIKSLSRGFSGISLDLLDRLIYFLQHNLTPVVPEKGSVGASGDLAPLAHLFLPVIGEGFFWNGNEKIKSKTVLKQHKLKPLDLNAKEGLALINGTQFILAHAIKAISKLDYLMDLADLAAAMSLEGFQGSLAPFRKELHELRPYKGSIKVANRISNLLDNSPNSNSHIDCDRVQDPYSIRCTPQVHGASRNALNHLKELVTIEINSVTDNPIILDDNSAISGGNFHAEPIAMVADGLALAFAEIGSLSERRMALLIDSKLSGLPPFLVDNGGVNSGFMIAQVTSAALASENKSLAHPASVDSLPTSANQEDHVSMATFAARRLADMYENTIGILAVEWLAACQGLDFLEGMNTSPALEQARIELRAQVPFYDKDRYFSPDIEKAALLLRRGVLTNLVEDAILVTAA